jgi:hypothetical protein
MLTLEQYKKFEDNMASILLSGKNVSTGEPFDIEKLDKKLDITLGEHFTFQNTQAAAHAGGTISAEVAQIIYNALGEVMSSSNGGWQKGVTTARKQSITQLMSELMAKQYA